MTVPLLKRRDLDFWLKEWLDLEGLLQRPRFSDHSVEGISTFLDSIEAIAENEVAPFNRILDQQEPDFDPDGNVRVRPEIKSALGHMRDAGLFGSTFDAELGGLQLPNVAHLAAMGILKAASVSMSGFMLLTTGNARLISTYGTEAQIDQFAKPGIVGDSLGTMCLSEPQAGSSLADIRTRAVYEATDGWGERFRLSGNKMWISGGDQDASDQIVHLVLAKVPEADGTLAASTRAISLFIVPKILPDGQRNDVTVAGLNHKMGFRGIPNCALNFGEGKFRPEGQSGAIGWRIGAAGQGLAQMFLMMNEARLTVGLGAAAMANRGYLLALDYARNRPQGRRIGHQDTEPVMIIHHADVRHMLLRQKALSEGAMALVLFGARLLDDEHTADSEAARKAAGAILSLLTPVAKTFPSEMGQVSLDLAIQIHGGAGYTRDYQVEQLYRDNRLNPIHEGTTGIQGMDLIGRKLRREQGASFKALRKLIETDFARAMRLDPLIGLTEALMMAWGQIDLAVEKSLVESDEARAQMHATAFLFAFGHGVVGWLWLQQAMVAQRALDADGASPDKAFYEGKIAAAQYFAEIELPRITAWLKPLMDGSDLVLRLNPEGL